MPRPVIFPPAYSVDPYVIMGGGYDPAEDANGSNDLGRGVYVINARTGHLVQHVKPTDYSVPGDITVVDTNADRIFDRAYFADVRGNLYRLNMADSTGALLPVASWSIKKIASLGGKVFSPPDVVVTRHFIAVMVGTGDREKPLLLSTRDRFFLIKDTLLSQPDRTEPLVRADLTRVARVDEDSPDEVVLKDVVTNVNNPNGCYFTLSYRGEKVVNTPFTIAGATYFGTNRPTPDSKSCTGTRGQARTYAFPLFCGVPRGVVLEGGGIPPSPVGGLVNITAADGSDTLVPFVIGSGAGRSPFEAERPRPPITPTRKRNYWQIHDGNR
jgi:type IV pilus assembly protein PilY1